MPYLARQPSLDSPTDDRVASHPLDQGHHDPALTLRTYAHVLERKNDDMGFLESDASIRDRSGTIRDKRST